MATTVFDDIGEVSKDHVLPLRLPPPNALVPRRESKSSELPIPPTTHPPTAMSESSHAKCKSKWKLFSAKPKPPIAASGDSSTLSEGTVEAQRLEKIPLAGVLGLHNSASKTETSKNIKGLLVPKFNPGPFLDPSSGPCVGYWNLPAIPIRAVAMESTCILAGVGKYYFAYISGTRDQRLTV
jgi:hypothetical protein